MFKTLLVPVDGSAIAEEALTMAAVIARASKGEIGLVFAHRPHREALIEATLNHAVPAEERIYVHRLAEDVARGAQIVVGSAVEVGAPVNVICHRAAELGADLIVMTTHGRTGLSRAWLGSVADGVVRTANVPVLMLRPGTRAPTRVHSADVDPFDRILVPLDGSTTSSAILPAAAALAKCGGGVLILLRVIEPVRFYVFDAAVPSYPTSIPDWESTKLIADDAHEELRTLAPQLEREFGVRVETIVETVTPAMSAAAGILNVAKSSRAEVIAMTTHGRGASRMIVGSVTDKVLRGGHLPMLLLRPRG